MKEDVASYDLEWVGKPEAWILPMLRSAFDTLREDTEAGGVLGAQVIIRIRRKPAEAEYKDTWPPPTEEEAEALRKHIGGPEMGPTCGKTEIEAHVFECLDCRMEKKNAEHAEAAAAAAREARRAETALERQDRLDREARVRVAEEEEKAALAARAEAVRLGFREASACGDKKGTLAGYRRHGRAGEKTCQACKNARAVYQRELNRRRKAGS